LRNILLTLYFYTTSACHLCETASTLLAQTTTPINIITVDIADDDKLILQYGTRIPVLKREDTLEELGWPFNLNELKAYLA
jgi:hypothetical protein